MPKEGTMNDFEDRMRKRARKVIEEIAQTEGVQPNHVVHLVQASIIRAREEAEILQTRGIASLAAHRESKESIELVNGVRLLR
jgi:hypothetical protein